MLFPSDSLNKNVEELSSEEVLDFQLWRGEVFMGTKITCGCLCMYVLLAPLCHPHIATIIQANSGWEEGIMVT